MATQDPWLEQFEARETERVRADRTFEVRGEKLTVKPGVAPEIGFRMSDFQARLAKFQIDARAAIEAGNEPPEDGPDNVELLDISEATIRACLEDDSIETWDRMRSPNFPRPFSLGDIYSFSTYVLSRAVELPTIASEGSSAGPQTNGRSSTVGSRSRARGKA